MDVFGINVDHCVDVRVHCAIYLPMLINYLLQLLSQTLIPTLHNAIIVNDITQMGYIVLKKVYMCHDCINTVNKVHCYN